MDKLDKLLQETEMFFYVEDKKISDIADKLTMHMKNKLYFNPHPLRINNGDVISSDFSTKNLRQSFFEKCVFESANYSDAGLAGSLFSRSFFKESNYHNTNFQSCDFRHCKFENIEAGFEYTRFNKSIFVESEFLNCIFNGISMNDVIFNNCLFRGCEWIPISIENAVFKNTILDNVKIKNMNFEFVTFDNIKLNNIKLPFPTIPYIYNGLTYLSETNDNVRITSAIKKEGLTIDEYMTNIDFLSDFYKYTLNYFPLVNILICKKMYNEAFAALINGVSLSIELRRFRMLRNYCKQLKYISGISMHDRQGLYNYILKRISSLDIQDFEYDNLNNYLPEVRHILLDDLNQEKIEISFSTNIETNEHNKVSVMLDTIEHLLINECTYSVELRHNSPWDFFVSIFTDLNNVSVIISAFTLLFTVVQTHYTKKQSTQQKTLYNDKESEKVAYAAEKLNSSNIIIVNLTINNNGNIQQINSNTNPAKAE